MTPKEPTKPDVSIWDELAGTSLHPLVPRIVARGRALEELRAECEALSHMDYFERDFKKLNDILKGLKI